MLFLGAVLMTREEITKKVVEIMEQKFELKDPGLDDDLREKHNFDSIDGLVLLDSIQQMISPPLTQDEKKAAMGIRTINGIVDYVEGLFKARS
jgi:acyl carrier protein